ncbi:MAG: GHKL domain-containing protein [Desulfobacteraceae bacterium]|jgi:signal transduction histidine kinase|nr:MAG: GHKL domain-containing protein [Desulfobacteraceae bacterium]
MTNRPHLYSASRGKQFRLVKFFAYASFLVLIAFSFPFSVVISQQAKDILMKSYENYALLIGENLNHQVFQNFVLPIVRRYGKVKLREKEQFEWMDQVVKNTVHSFKINLVNIYDVGKGIIAYSTDQSLVGQDVPESLGYKKAVKGEHFSGLVSTWDDFLGIGLEIPGGEKKLRTFIPFVGIDPFTGDKGPLLGVFELIQDLTEEYRSIVNFQYLVFGLSASIMALIFVALLLIVHKAENILAQRAEEQRKLEAQLNQSERLAALGQMCAGVSHEIRNPLGIIRSTAELLASMTTSTESQKKLSSMIIEESGRLNDIVTEFLDFARPQTPNLQEVNLDEILRKNLQFLLPQIEKEQVSVRHNLEGLSFRIKADPQMLYRAFLNILANALQAMEQTKKMLSIELSDANDHYLITIQDSGCGIKRENLDKIFNPFFSTKDKGSGLGLSIVRNIIESHNGTIEIESTEGMGTAVKMKLPKLLQD